uniref:FAT domain-containing protein n=1 Tax=Caenorhabditis tropicalis TaxID=1561998 RepID=A0A1I7UJR0_9PELO
MSENIDELPEIKYLDSLDYLHDKSESSQKEIHFRWIETFETDSEIWFRMLQEFIFPMSGRNGYYFRIVEKYAEAIHFRGAEVTQTKGGLRHLSNASPRFVGEQGSLPTLVSKISEITKEVNVSQYMSSVLSHIGQTAKPAIVAQKFLNRERFANLCLLHSGYRPGLEALLSNYRLLQHFRYAAKRRRDLLTDHIRDLFSDRDLYTQTPEASSLSLQMVLEDWNCTFQDEKIAQLSHGNTLQMRSLHVKGDAYFILIETLNCALALNYPLAQEEMESFASIIDFNSTNARCKLLFQFWRMISKYERNQSLANPQGFLIAAQRLEEECKSELVGLGCTVLVESACKIRSRCDQQYDYIIETITETVSRHPALGPRLMQLAEHCTVGYEREVLLHQMCDLESHNRGVLHPSESTWLNYVEKLVQIVGRFGSVRNTIENSLKIMFEFLDFDFNRFNERAWFLMKKVLELADPSFVIPEWEIRKGWWPKYQLSRTKHGRKMAKAAMHTRKLVLEALEEIII